MNEEKSKISGDLHEEFCNLIDKYKDKLGIDGIICSTFATIVGGLKSMDREGLTNSLTLLLNTAIDCVYLNKERCDDAT